MASDSHGGTKAAWTAVVIIILGCLVSAFALPLGSPTMFFAGFGVIVLGVIVGKVMSMMGMGNTVAYEDQRDPDYDQENADAPSSSDTTADQQPDQSTREPAS